MGNAEKDDLKRVLIRRAMGFYSRDVTEEYDAEDGGRRLVKRKVNRKFNPPDIGALRELLKDEDGASVASMTDAELDAERERLLSELKRSVKEKEKGE